MPRPTRIVADGKVLAMAGLTLHLSAYRDVEAPCMLVTEVLGANAVFAADMVEHATTAFLLEGRAAGWLAAVEQLEKALPHVSTLYPGHGAAGAAPMLIAAQRAYLSRLLRLIEVGMDDPALPAVLDRQFPGCEPVAAIPDLAVQSLAALRER